MSSKFINATEFIFSGSMNDLWEFDNDRWTWLSGTDSLNQPGIYNSPVASENVPGARFAQAMTADTIRNVMWLFAGYNFEKGIILYFIYYLN